MRQETRKQENIESITAQAAATLPESAHVEGLEEDWVANFFKHCDTVSDVEMQSLWARLLAGEATTPGSYSMRTVDFISTIDKKDAALFTTFSQFVWMIGAPTPLIYEVEDEIYRKNGITFETLKHLDAIGLISFESLSGYMRKGFKKHATVHYHGEPQLLEFQNEDDNRLQVGHALLTSTGAELVRISGAIRNADFQRYVWGRWCEQGVGVASLLVRRGAA